MKTAKEWLDEPVNEPYAPPGYRRRALTEALVRAIQADALEAAAERLREEAVLLAKEAGPSVSGQLAIITMQHAAEVVRKLKPGAA